MTGDQWGSKISRTEFLELKLKALLFEELKGMISRRMRVLLERRRIERDCAINQVTSQGSSNWRARRFTL